MNDLDVPFLFFCSFLASYLNLYCPQHLICFFANAALNCRSRGSLSVTRSVGTSKLEICSSLITCSHIELWPENPKAPSSSPSCTFLPLNLAYLSSWACHLATTRRRKASCKRAPPYVRASQGALPLQGVWWPTMNLVLFNGQATTRYLRRLAWP